MYDEKNEEVSFSEKKIDELTDYILSNDILSQIKLQGAIYIKNNFTKVKN